ncbi:MAG: SDR family NAD(P)-dependent oxidoreductase [Kiritimatiellae bacterium]|nr:SDR family NAD(P)-dependent oxidoreductase [Kiritimatiellia bacterium]
MTTLITGASSGIGAALAIESARRGGRLFICGRDKARLDAVAGKCRDLGATVRADIVDVADEAATRRWLESCDAESPIDRVFANAGVSTGEETEANVRRTFAVNVGGTVNTVLPVIELFRRRGRGQIVITASIAGYGPLKACPSYAATKSCLKTWGLSLRGALAREGIRVSVVCPGFVRSRITDKNTCPMPFFMEAEKAAAIILTRADRNTGLIAFPWPMRLASWGLSILPQRLNELVGRVLPKKA